MNEQALKDRLHAIAKEKSIHFNECWKNLLLERFLARLARSSQMDKFIFKGGFLLAYMLEIGRETTDLDFLLSNMNASEEQIKQAVQDIISGQMNDGFVFTYETIELLEQPHMDYPGYRVTLRVEFGRMRGKIQIDVGIGDVVKPSNRDFCLFQYRGKPMFENAISLSVYPPETIFAEKLETVISKGASNSRMKDYHDLLLLSRHQDLLDKKNLQNSIESTFKNRGTILSAIEFDETDLRSLQKLWTAHLKNLGDIAQELKIPKEIQAVINEINMSTL